MSEGDGRGRRTCLKPDRVRHMHARPGQVRRRRAMPGHVRRRRTRLRPGHRGRLRRNCYRLKTGSSTLLAQTFLQRSCSCDCRGLGVSLVRAVTTARGSWGTTSWLWASSPVKGGAECPAPCLPPVTQPLRRGTGWSDMGKGLVLAARLSVRAMLRVGGSGYRTAAQRES